jgi:hypothetical protein
MTVFYMDASAWVKWHIVEEGSEWVERFWTARPAAGSSTLGLIEVTAAIVRRHRGGRVAPGATAQVLQALEEDFSEMTHVQVDADVLRLAKDLARSHALRGADCIHLASAFRLGEITGRDVAMIASDAELLAAARAEGLAVLDPRTNPPLPESPT